MKKMPNNQLKKLLVFLVCLVMFLSVAPIKVHAFRQQQKHEQKQEQEQREEDFLYVLVYPDGKKVRVPTLEEVKELEEQEVVLVEEAVTDENGQIILEGWMKDAEIRIEEIEVPEGYTADESETTTKLSEGQVEITNTKDEEPVEPIEPEEIEEPKPQPEKIKPVTTNRVEIPKTGIEIPLKQKQQTGQEEGTEEPAGPPAPTEVDPETIDFVINKVDQNGEPVVGSKFKIYGKPTLYFRVTLFKVFRIYQVEQQQQESISPLFNLLFNYFVKTIHAEDEPEHTIEKDYIETSVKIEITGDGTSISFVADAPQTIFEVLLKAGTYTMKETTELAGTDADKEAYQSYLKSYQFSIDEDGNMEKIGDAQWQWLISEDGKYKFIDVLPEYLPSDYIRNDILLNPYVNVIFLDNFASPLPIQEESQV